MFFYIVLVDNFKLSGPAGQAQHMEQTKKQHILCMRGFQILNKCSKNTSLLHQFFFWGGGLCHMIKLESPEPGSG